MRPGQRDEQLFARWALMTGWEAVERATPVVRWVPTRGGHSRRSASDGRINGAGTETSSSSASLRPLSLAHDFFGCWDIIAKSAFEGFWFVQIGTVEHLAEKRTKVEACGPWPVIDGVRYSIAWRSKGGVRSIWSFEDLTRDGWYDAAPEKFSPGTVDRWWKARGPHAEGPRA